MKRRGFTLVELLVVITIISILAAMLLPTLQNALEQTRISACSGNTRQFTMGLLTYITDTNDIVPGHPYEARRGCSFLGMGYLVSGKYIQDLSIMICPTAPPQIDVDLANCAGIPLWYNPYDHTSTISPYGAMYGQNIYRQFWQDPGNKYFPLGTYYYHGGAVGGSGKAIFADGNYTMKLSSILMPHKYAPLFDWDSTREWSGRVSPHALIQGKTYAYLDGHSAFRKHAYCTDCAGLQPYHFTPVMYAREVRYIAPESKETNHNGASASYAGQSNLKYLTQIMTNQYFGTTVTEVP